MDSIGYIWIYMAIFMGMANLRIPAANAGLISADEPILKSIEAAYKQTGLENNVDTFSNYVVTNYMNRVSIVRVGSGLYGIYRNQCINFDVRPFRVELRPDSSRIDWTINL